MSTPGSLSPVVDALSVAILHGLWQGSVIGLVTAGTLAAMSRCSARARYAVACLALGLMLVGFAASFGFALGDALKVDASATTAGTLHFQPVNAGTPPSPLGWLPGVFRGQSLGSGDTGLPSLEGWIAVAWLIGAVFVALSGVLQFAAVRRLRAGARFDVYDRWREAFEAVSSDLGLDRLARLGHSAAVEVPTVVGWLAPIVLVPLASCTALSSDEICAILAHELAHIRRRDYLVNAVQKVVEVVLFFHPVTWWLSRRIREEREYCCDDVAVHYTHSALRYARALSHLETFRTQGHGYALGADGGSLMKRITRIVGSKPERRQLSIIGGALAALIVAVVGVGMVLGGPGVAFAGGPTATPGPSGANVPPAVVAAAQNALAGLVANGTINQSQADTIEQALAGGVIDEQALVSSGVVTDAQMQTVRGALVQVKQTFAQQHTPTEPQGDVSGPSDAIIAAARSALDALVANGTINQSQEDKIMQAVSSGSVEPQTLVEDGVVSAAQLQAVSDALDQVKRSFATTNPVTKPDNAAPDCDAAATKLAQAVKGGKLTQAQADQLVADCRNGVVDATKPGAEAPDCNAIATKLTQAVKDGMLTQEQANQKVAACNGQSPK